MPARWCSITLTATDVGVTVTPRSHAAAPPALLFLPFADRLTDTHALLGCCSLLQTDTGIATTNYDINSAGAEIYESSTEPSPSAPGNDGSAQKPKAAADDGSLWTTSYYAPNTNDGSYNYQMYKFVINETKPKLTGIKLYWKGYGEPTPGYNTSLYIWNFTFNRWDEIHNTLISNETGKNIQKYEDFQPYCYKCHGGSVPPGVKLGSITRNISASYPTDYHGSGESTNDLNTAIKGPYTRGNSALPCADCHDLHGSQNAYHLREKVNGQAVNLPSMAATDKYDTSKNAAILTYCQSCHTGTLDDFHMAKCLSCHRDPGAHDCAPPTANDFSRACTYCHTHGGKMPAHGLCHCTLGTDAKAF